MDSLESLFYHFISTYHISCHYVNFDVQFSFQELQTRHFAITYSSHVKNIQLLYRPTLLLQPSQVTVIPAQQGICLWTQLPLYHHLYKTNRQRRIFYENLGVGVIIIRKQVVSLTDLLPLALSLTVT